MRLDGKTRQGCVCLDVVGLVMTVVALLRTDGRVAS